MRSAFSQAHNERFMVITEVPEARSAYLEGQFSISTFDHEDTFLELLIQAGLSEDEVARTALSVLSTIAKPQFPPMWVELDLTPEQCASLQLKVATATHASASSSVVNSTSFDLFRDPAVGISMEDFLLQAPTPFTILMGPEHRFTFINPPYVHLLGRTQPEALLAKSVREALPELEGQPFFGLLDTVYRTGESHVGVETKGNLVYEDGVSRDLYFDFIYQPVHDATGSVVGIMAQAMDVTERVLDRHVSQSREEQLYHQWAELETIYRNSPVGMALVDANDFRILRINDRNANLAGRSSDELIGQNILDVFPDFPELSQIFARVKLGHNVQDQEAFGSVPSAPGIVRSWLSNFSPIWNGDRTAVVSIACAAFEISEDLERVAQFSAERKASN